MNSKVWFGCDHAGLELKRALVDGLRGWDMGIAVEDLGCHSDVSVHYPDFAKEVGLKVSEGLGRGVLVCGSGIGMSIAANKVPGVRAAMVWDVTSARLSRSHNDSNIVCLGARTTGLAVALDILKTWLTTPFEGGRHQLRIERISEMER